MTPQAPSRGAYNTTRCSSTKRPTAKGERARYRMLEMLASARRRGLPAPSLREFADALGFYSESTVGVHMMVLHQRELVENFGPRRGWHLTSAGFALVQKREVEGGFTRQQVNEALCTVLGLIVAPGPDFHEKPLREAAFRLFEHEEKAGSHEAVVIRWALNYLSTYGWLEFREEVEEKK